MPLTFEEQEKLRIQYGLPEGTKFEEVEDAPEAAPELSTGDVVSTRLKRAIVPGLTSLYGAAKGGSIGGIPGAIIGGIGTALTTSWGQEQLLKNVMDEKNYEASLQKYQQAGEESPILSTLVDMIPNAAALRPNTTALKALKKLPFLPRGVKLDNAAKAAFAGSAAEGAIGGAVDATLQKTLEGREDINWPRVAMSTLGSGVMSQPYGPLGRRLFPSGNIIPGRSLPEVPPELQTLLNPPPVDPNGPSMDFYANEADVQPSLGQAIPEWSNFDNFSPPAGSPAAVSQFDPPVLQGLGELEINAPGNWSLGPKTIDKLLNVDPYSQSVKGLADGTKLPKKVSPEKIEKQKEDSSVAAALRTKPVDPSIPAPALSSKDTSVGEVKIEDLDDNMRFQEAEEAIIGSKEDFNRIQGELKSKVDEGARTGDNDTLFSSAAKLGQLQQPLDKVVYNQGESSYTNLSPEDLQFAHELATRRGTTIKEAIDLLAPSGKVAAGAQNIKTRETSLNPRAAGSDTPSHEIAGHQFVEDLLASTNPKDNVYARRAIEAVGGDKEALAQAVGERIVQTRQKPIRSWLEDIFTGDKTKMIARKALYDKPFSEDAPMMEGAMARLTPESQQEGDIKYSSSGGTKAVSQAKLDPINKRLASTVERLNDLGTREGKLGSKALDNFETDLTRNIGKYVNRPVGAVKSVKDKNGLRDYLYDMRRSGTSKSSLYNENHPVVKAIRQHFKDVHDDQRSLAIKVQDSSGAWRDPMDNPYYMPNMVDPSIIKEIVDNGPNKAKLLRDYENFLADKVNNPKETITDYLNALKSNTRGTSEFAAIRKAEGFGLPDSWLEKDLVKLFERYGAKVARDFSFHKNVESSPQLRTIFGLDKPGFLKDENAKMFEDGNPIEALGGDLGTAAKNRLTGQYAPESVKLKTAEQLVRSGLLGTLSAVKNHVGAYVQMQPYIPLQYQGNIVKAWGQLSKGLKDSMDKGVNRWDITSLELGDYMTDRWGAKIANFLRTAQGYKHIEQYTRAHNMMVGELAAESMWQAAARGGREELNFFNKFKGDNKLDFSKPPTPELLKELAANFVERVQGSYNTKGLPHQLTEPTSYIYWLMSLSKWGVERANIVRQDVVRPALQGEYGPLLRYTLSSIIGGAGIRELTELLNNKKQEVPTYKESLASKKGDLEGITYQTANLLQLAGWAGIYGDIVKMGLDAAHGNKPRTPNIVSVGFFEDILKGVTDMAGAAQEGSLDTETVLSGIGNILTDYVQGLRLLANNTYKAENQQRSDKFRDKRVWERLEDKPRNNASYVENNRLANVEERRYKQTGDIREARKLLRDDLLPKYAELSPQDRAAKLQGLRRNSYQILPSEPRDLREYLNYIKESQGIDAMRELQRDKTRQDAVNRQKTSMVPIR